MNNIFILFFFHVHAILKIAMSDFSFLQHSKLWLKMPHFSIKSVFGFQNRSFFLNIITALYR